MTGEQKNQIADLRAKGFGYATIAQALGLSKSTVTSHCQRNKLGGIKANHSATVTPDKEYCKHCGKELIQISGKKKLKVCNQQCRITWWNSNQDKVNKKAIYSFTCASCGSSFTAYGNSKRKYCSHDCYINDRFKGGDVLTKGRNPPGCDSCRHILDFFFSNGWPRNRQKTIILL